MKKLALLLAALSVASVSYAKEVMPVADVVVVEEVAVVEEAAPMFRATSVGQYLEIDNNAGSGDGNVGDVIFGNKVNFAYGDVWTMGVTARKSWNDVDTSENAANPDGGMDNYGETGSRVELWAKRDFGSYTLGTKWRGQPDYDKFYVTGSYGMGDFSGWADVAYVSADTHVAGEGDYWNIEMEPVQYSVGPVEIALYNNYEGYVGKGGESGNDTQIRVRGNYYETEKLALGAELRYGIYSGDLSKDVDTNQDLDTYMGFELNAAYAVTENLTIDGYYLYEISSFEGKNGAKDFDDAYYGEFNVGWTYSF